MSSTPESFLLSRLRAQLEFYFSPQNLARDVYLRNLLSSYGFNAVPLSIIANFPKVRSLCNGQIDLALLKRAVEGSGIVHVTNDAVWISPLLPIPPLDASKQQRAPLGVSQVATQQQQQEGGTLKVGDAGDGSMPPSASSSQNSLTAAANGYVKENGGFPTKNVNAAATAIHTAGSSGSNQSLHNLGQNSLPDTPQAQLPPQPSQLNGAAPHPHQQPQPQPQPTHPNNIPYNAAPIAHTSHGGAAYAYPQYTYRYPIGSAGGPTYHHHSSGGYSAYPSHMVPYQVYGYPPYVQSGGGRGYFAGGRGGSGGSGTTGPMGSRPNGEVENGGIRRGSTGGGKGNTDGAKKGKGKPKKGTGMHNYQHHHQGVDPTGHSNNQSYGGSTQQQHQQQRWKGDRGDSGSSSKDGNDSYGKQVGRNHHHHPRGAGKYDNVGWDRMNRSSNRSQNDVPPPTDGEGRITTGDTFYPESTNPLSRVSGAGPLHAKSGGGRKKKGKRRDSDAERRKDSNVSLTAEDPKREIFDANSFPALSSSPTKNDAIDGGRGPNQPKSSQKCDGGVTKVADPGASSIHPMSGYADALKQNTKSSRPSLIVEQQPLASSVSVGQTLHEKAAPQTANTSTAVVIPPPVETMSTTINKVIENTFADMKIAPSLLEPSQLQEPHLGTENHTATTTIAVGALTGMPTTTTEVEPKNSIMSLENTNSGSPAAVSPTDVVPNAQQSTNAEPTPKEASHSGTKLPEQDISPAVLEESERIVAGEEQALDSLTPSPPPSVWGNKRSYIDVARK